MPHYLLFQLLFLIFFALHLAVERLLSLLNSRYVYSHRNEVPEPVREAITPDTYARSIDYALARARLGHVAAVIASAETLFFLFSGFIGMLDEWLRRFHLSELSEGVALLLAFMLVRAILDLPMQLYSAFRLESRFGFNKTTAQTFWLDRVKGLLVSAILGVPFAYGILAFMMHSGPLWWVWASLFVIAFQAAMMVIVPIFIMPLFNKFTPLQEGDLKTRLESLAQACRFAARGIFVMDGSKRSAHSNAFFTGLGKSRRIVLFDTLIAQLSTDELAAVLAHEIGHYKRKHIVQWLVVTSFMVFVGFAALSLLIDWRPMYEAFNAGAPSKAVGLIIFMLIAGDFTFWVGPLFSALSRQHEYEADAYAARQTSVEPMSNALLKLSEKNLATLRPHPLYSAYHYSHPTTLERIAALRGK